MSRRPRRRPGCGGIVLALAALVAGALVVLHELAVWIGAHPAVVGAVVGLGVLSAPAANKLDAEGKFGALSPTEFEEAIAALCRRDGCRDVQVVGGAGDLGADVIATLPDGRRMVVQCKRYAPGRRVGSPEVQRVGGTYAVVHRADLAVVVTTAGFTDAAVEYAARAGIRLIDGGELAVWRDGAWVPWM